MLLVLYIPVILSFVASSHNGLICNRIKVSVKDSSVLKFVSESEINDLIQTKFKTIQGSLMNEINTQNVEQAVNRYPAVEKCEVYPSIDGTLCVVVSQRQPALRIFDHGATYLLDAKGYKIPLRGTYKDHLMVANGYIDDIERRQDLLKLNSFISDDSFWSAQIEQIYVEPDGEFILIPRVGQHKILFGNITDMEKKFRNLRTLYEKGLNPLEWNSYQTINLKFKGQVICSKK